MEVPQIGQTARLKMIDLVVAKVENLKLCKAREDSFGDSSEAVVAEVESDQFDLVGEEEREAVLSEMVVGEVEEEETVEVGEQI